MEFVIWYLLTVVMRKSLGSRVWDSCRLWGVPEMDEVCGPHASPIGGSPSPQTSIAQVGTASIATTISKKSSSDTVVELLSYPQAATLGVRWRPRARLRGWRGRRKRTFREHLLYTSMSSNRNPRRRPKDHLQFIYQEAEAPRGKHLVQINTFVSHDNNPLKHQPGMEVGENHTKPQKFNPENVDLFTCL